MIRRGRKGVTLVEAMACLAIAAALGAIAAANLRGGRDGVGLRAALVELESQDRLMRDRARRWGGRGELAFDAENGQVTRTELGPDKRAREVKLQAFADGVRVERVLVTTTSGHGDDRGTVRVGCSSAGRTPTYAVLVSAGANRQWVVVVGITGKFERVDDEAQVEDIFLQLRAADGDDAR